MTPYEEARYQLQWHLDNGRGPFDLVFAAVAAGDAAEAKLAEAERERDGLRFQAEKQVVRAERAENVLADAESREKELREALLDLLDNIGGHGHWDSTMQHGAGCDLCIQQNAAKERARAALAAGKPEESDHG